MSTRRFLSDALAVMSNELRLFRHNRTAIIISLLIVPVFFTLSLGGATGGAGETFSPTTHIPIVFVDNDLTAASSRLYNAISSSGNFDKLIQGYREDNALALLGTGRIFAVIIVPEGFQKTMANGNTASLVVYTDDSVNGLEDELSFSLRKILQDFKPDPTSESVTTRKPSGIEIVRKGATFSGFVFGLTIILALVTIFATFYEIAGGMSRESEEGTYARLLLSPTSLAAVIVGKSMHDLLLNVIRTFVVFGIAVYVYGGRPNTDFGTILVLSLLISLLTMSFGFLISALGVGVRAVIIIEFFLVLFLFSFSGFIIDRELLRGISQTISYALPWAYGMELLRGTMLVGQPLSALWSQLAFVLASTALFYGIAYILLRLSRERLVM